MKITIFNGSPKGKRSNTHVMSEALMKGMSAAGAQVENVFLCKKEIKHCLGCLNCWIKTPGKCVHKDDMPELMEKFQTSDIAAIATPLYVDNVSGMTKVFMDRLMPAVDPHFEDIGDGETSHVETEGPLPKIMVISSCGFPEQSQFQVLQLLFRRMVRNMRSELVAEVYRGQGNLLSIEHEMLKPVVSNYCSLLEKAGREIVEIQSISDATAAELNKELIPKAMYIDGANRHWDTMQARALEKQK